MTEILIPKKNLIIDASVLSSLMSCGTFTDLRYNHNFVSLDGKSNSLEVGSLVHKILEVYRKGMINRLRRQDAIDTAFLAGEMYIRGCQFCTDFVSSHGDDTNITLGQEALFHEGEHRCTSKCIMKPQCGHQIDEYPGLQNTPQESTSSPNKIGWKWALETVQQYFDYYKNDSWVTLEAEVTKGEVLYEDEDIRILWKAKLDWVVDTNQGIYPVDTKTMKQRRDSVSLNNQFIGQCLIMKTRNIFIDKIGFQTSLEPKDKFSRPAISYTSDRLIEWQSVTLPFWGKMYQMYQETGYWPQNFTHCENKYGMCQFKSVCEADRGMREEELKLHFRVGKVWEPFDD